MTIHDPLNYQRIEQAIGYIQTHFKAQPSLATIAQNIGVSPCYLQRMFTQWAGVSPKKFMQYLTINYAKQVLKKQPSTLLDATWATGLSSASRLHDLFVNIEGMTPGEFKNGGKALSINYQFFDSHFGNIVIASTTKGVCYLAFEENKQQALVELQASFPHANYQYKTDHFQQDALGLFQGRWHDIDSIKLHVNGSQFQLKVWAALLSIPSGKLTTYGNIANHIEKPKAARAVGTAIGANPVALLIPCHRVIQASGVLGGYRWGLNKKSALIGWEASTINSQDN